MSAPKNSLENQLPTSDELRAAITPELQALARKGLKDQGVDLGAEIQAVLNGELSKAAPLLAQPKTMPLISPQNVPGVAAPPPAAPARVAAAAAAPAASVVPAPSARSGKIPAQQRPVSGKVAAAPKPAAKKRSHSTLVIGIMGLVVVGASGAAVWAKHNGKLPMGLARAEPAAAAQPAETAVKFVVPARPAGEEPAPAETAAAAPTPDPAPPETAAAAPTIEPAPPATMTTAANDPPAAKTSEPKIVHRSVRPSAPPSEEPKRVAAAPAKAEPKPDDKKPAAPATAAPSVDAILQQQLKSAIP